MISRGEPTDFPVEFSPWKSTEIIAAVNRTRSKNGNFPIRDSVTSDVAHAFLGLYLDHADRLNGPERDRVLVLAKYAFIDLSMAGIYDPLVKTDDETATESSSDQSGRTWRVDKEDIDLLPSRNGRLDIRTIRKEIVGVVSQEVARLRDANDAMTVLVYPAGAKGSRRLFDVHHADQQRVTELRELILMYPQVSEYINKLVDTKLDLPEDTDNTLNDPSNKFLVAALQWYFEESRRSGSSHYKKHLADGIAIVDYLEGKSDADITDALKDASTFLDEIAAKKNKQSGNAILKI